MIGRSVGRIAIIGGGPVGLSTGLHLAQRGAGERVTIFERDTSYQRCSALLSAGGIRQQFSLRENILMSKKSVEFLSDLEKRCKDYDINFKRNGYLFLGTSEEDKAILEANNRTQREAGVNWIHLATKDELSKRFPWLDTSDVIIGSYSAQGGEGYFDPWAFLQALRCEARELGVTFEKAGVSKADIREGPDGYTIQALHFTDRASESFEHVVNCSGAWSGVVFEGLTQGLTEDQREALGKVPIARKKRSVFSVHCPGTMDCSHPVPPTDTPLTIDPSGVYFRSEGNAPGHFICGVSPSDDPDCDNDEVLDHVDHDLFYEVIWPQLAERVPAFNELKVQGFWSGFYDTNTLDHNLIIGKHPDFQNLYTLSGLSGHGLQMAPAAGEAMAEMLLGSGGGQSIDLTRFGHERIARNEGVFETGIV